MGNKNYINEKYIIDLTIKMGTNPPASPRNISAKSMKEALREAREAIEGNNKYRAMEEAEGFSKCSHA